MVKRMVCGVAREEGILTPSGVRASRAVLESTMPGCAGCKAGRTERRRNCQLGRQGTPAQPGGSRTRPKPPPAPYPGAPHRRRHRLTGSMLCSAAVDQ